LQSLRRFPRPSARACHGSAVGQDLHIALQGDLNALDPYTLNEGFTLGALGNVYEGLTKRDKDLKIIPGLAERWKIIDPLKWRSYLRTGVKFQNGEDFTADDVIFTAEAHAQSGFTDYITGTRRHEGRQGRRLYRRFCFGRTVPGGLMAGGREPRATSMSPSLGSIGLSSDRSSWHRQSSCLRNRVTPLHPPAEECATGSRDERPAAAADRG
jgi:Bacterial extracellular solute-binding proteins, family 5 Middle